MRQREVLVGVLLGECVCLRILNLEKRTHTYQMLIEKEDVKDCEYVYHLYELFKEWVTPQGQSMNVMLAFSTINHASFRFYAHQFYGKNGDKKIPKLIHRWLTPMGLAYWYMDEGSISYHGELKSVFLRTHSCLYSEVSRLAQTLGIVFGLQALVCKRQERYQVFILDESVGRFFEWIRPYVFKSMRYKIPL